MPIANNYGSIKISSSGSILKKDILSYHWNEIHAEISGHVFRGHDDKVKKQDFLANILVS